MTRSCTVSAISRAASASATKPNATSVANRRAPGRRVVEMTRRVQEFSSRIGTDHEVEQG
jgi:hypothetical protein